MNHLYKLLTLIIITTATAQESPLFTSAAFFDENADGFVDKLTINYTYTGIETFSAQELMYYLVFPSKRNLIIEDFEIDAEQLTLHVTENSVSMNTAVTEADTLSIVEGVTANGILLYNTTLAIEDSMAPVLTRAAYFDRSNSTPDIFKAWFSEPVEEPILSGKPFQFFSNYTNYSMYLTPVSTEQHEVEYEVGLSEAVPVTGDSVNIAPASGVISDLYGNRQMNVENRSVAFQVIQPVAIAGSPQKENHFFSLIGNRTISLQQSLGGGETELYTVAGKRIFRTRFTEHQRSVVLPSTLSPGTYILSITTKTAVVKQKITLR